MNPDDLQSDCCGARFMLNDIYDAMNGRFDYDGEELRRKYQGAHFLCGCFIPKCVEKFLKRRKVNTQFTAVESLDLAVTNMSGKEMSKKVLDAVFDGFEKARQEFEITSTVLMPKIAARLKTTRKFKSLLQSVKIEQEHYLRSKKLRNIDEESMLSALVLTASNLAEELSRLGQKPADLADKLRGAHGGIQYCIDVPQSLMRDGWGTVA